MSKPTEDSIYAMTENLTAAGLALVKESNETWSVVRTTSPADRPSRALAFAGFPRYADAVRHVHHWAKVGGLLK